nr:immunoglobulin light chain junction region [Macaca mulatta]MOX20090.1 immunoglobulin light chain junction region [Macaca mulatta]MOX21391.1 immunoglobulin light chain junction region [Macaca mulatta]MOX21776.1 immunoglobulin light chain junction region [Macaca mulatta]
DYYCQVYDSSSSTWVF